MLRVLVSWKGQWARGPIHPCTGFVHVNTAVTMQTTPPPPTRIWNRLSLLTGFPNFDGDDWKLVFASTSVTGSSVALRCPCLFLCEWFQSVGFCHWWLVNCEGGCAAELRLMRAEIAKSKSRTSPARMSFLSAWSTIVVKCDFCWNLIVALCFLY